MGQPAVCALSYGVGSDHCAQQVSRAARQLVLPSSTSCEFTAPNELLRCFACTLIS